LTQVLVFEDPRKFGDVNRGRSSLLWQHNTRARSMFHISLDSVLKEFRFDFFLAGFHACVVDTRDKEPDELLSLTVDYVHVVKHEDERSFELKVHHFQVDQFIPGREIIVAPQDSGLSSPAPDGHLKKRVGSSAHPWLSLKVQGPRDDKVKVFDHQSQVVALDSIDLQIRPIDVNLYVQDVAVLAVKIVSWFGVMLSGSGSPVIQGDLLVREFFKAGISTPARPVKVLFSINRLRIEALSVATDIRIGATDTSTGKFDEDEDEDEDDAFDQIHSLLPFLPHGVFSIIRGVGSFVEASPHFNFAKLTVPPIKGTIDPAIAFLMKHYIKQGVAQSVLVGASLPALGDPAALIGDVGGGISGFYVKTRQEVMGQRDTVGDGVKDLADGVIGGALESVSKIAGTMKRGVGNLTGDPLKSNGRPKNLAEGLQQGIQTVADTVTLTVNGVAERPIRAAKEGGLGSFAEATVQGAVGVIFSRPVEGVCAFTESVAQGAAGQVRLDKGCYAGLRRPPRAEFQQEADDMDGILCLTRREHRNTLEHLRRLHVGFFWPSWRLRVKQVSLPALWKDNRVMEVVLSLGSIEPCTTIHITRGQEVNTWTTSPGRPENLAIGRTGSLRGPFRLDVDAMLLTNVPLTEPLRAHVASGSLPVEHLAEALLLPEERVANRQLHFKPKPIGRSSVGHGEWEASFVTVELCQYFDTQIMPMDFLNVSPGETGSQYASRRLECLFSQVSPRRPSNDD